MISTLEEFIQERAQKITNAIEEKWGESIGLRESLKIEGYKYERALHNATSFFYKFPDIRYDDEALSYLKHHLEIKLEKPKSIQKMSPEEMLANVITIDINDALMES